MDTPLRTVRTNIVQSIRAFRVQDLQDAAQQLGQHFLYANLAHAQSKQDVLDLIADGLGNKEIATRLDLSVRTVESHRINIKRKFELDSSAALMKFAMERRRERG